MHDRTKTAVTRQLKGMGCDLYEVGVRHPERGMLNREWSAAEVLKSLEWLKRENVKGCDIYIRPARSGQSRLILVDDLPLNTITRMTASDHAPAVTVQTSPGNYQAWVKLNDHAPAAVRREVARLLARTYGADPNSADSAHYGRLAGFTNRKPHHMDGLGRSPFVLLDTYNGKAAPAAHDLARAAQEAAERDKEAGRAMAAHIQTEARAMPASSPGDQSPEALAEWYREFWQGLRAQFGDDFDGSRADWMAAVAMFRKGYDYFQVAQAIAEHSPAVTNRKGAAVADYVTRTAGKAEIWHELKAQGAHYTDVADSLLTLAQERKALRT